MNLLSILSGATRPLMRMAVCLVLLLGATCDTVAQTTWSVWNGTDATPSGVTTLRPKSLIDPSATGDPGSATNPYIIESAADLKYLQQTPSLWGKCFEQVVDIDLAGHELGTIGYALCGTEVVWTTAKNQPTYNTSQQSVSVAFTGDYDGRGHVIRNLLVDWGHLSSGGYRTSSFGLFGFVGGGAIQNITIQDAVIRRGTDAVSFETQRDCMVRVGVLVGALSHGDDGTTTRIENIIVNNSVIRDYDTTPGDAVGADATNMFFGGVIGDIANGNCGTTAIGNPIRINNCYADVDISLENTTRNPRNRTDYPDYTCDPTAAKNRGWQFIVGGIVGRLRGRYVTDLPTNTIYTGTVNAPISVIGPCYGGARCGSKGGDRAQDVTHNYAGNFTTGGTLGAAYDEGRNFFDYTVNGETVTGTYPSGQAGDYASATNNPTRGCLYGTRTLAPNNFPSNDYLSHLDAEFMKAYQGVNHGTYLDGATAAGDWMRDYNADHQASMDYLWHYDAASKTAAWDEKVKTARSLSLTAGQTNYNAYTATLTGAEAGEEFHYRWFAVDAAGMRTEMGTSVTSVFETGDALPTGTCDMIVFLCNTDGTFYQDNGHYVYALCPVAYSYVLDFDVTAASDKACSLVQPIVKVMDTATGTLVRTIPLGDEWTFDIKVFEGNTTRYEFPTPFAAADAPYTLPPSVKQNVYIQLFGSANGKQLVSEKKPMASWVKVVNNAAGWKRVKAEDGQRFTLTFQNADDESVYFDSGKTLAEDWGISYVWSIGTYKGDATDNGIKDKSLTLSEEWEEDGTLRTWVKDWVVRYRYYDLKLTDMYGMSADNVSFKWGDAWIDTPHTNLRYLVALDEFQHYHFKYMFHNGTYVGEDNKDHDNPYITLNPDMSGAMHYTYRVEDSDTEVNLPLDVTLDDFSIPYVYLGGRKYIFKVHDIYGYSVDFKESLTLTVPDIDIATVGDSLLPELNYGGRKYRFREEDGRGLTYQWTVEYYDGDGVLIGARTQTFSGNGVPSLEYFDAKHVLVRLTVTDCMGATRTVEKTYSLEKLYVDVVQSGTAPNYTFTAALKSFSDLPLYGGTWQWYGVNGDITDQESNRYLLDGETSRVITLDNSNNNYNSYCVVWTSEDGTVTLMGYWSKADIVYVFNREQTEEFNSGTGNIAVRAENVGRFQAMLDKKNDDDTPYYPDGNDYNTGRTPTTAVRTMKRAYELLDASKGAKENVIVVMGYLGDNDYLHVRNEGDYTHDYDRNATVTGSYGEISDGIIRMDSHGSYGDGDVNGLHALGGTTIFRDITLYGLKEYNSNHVAVSKGQLFLYCHLHDITFGNGVKMEAYQDYSKNKEGIYDSPASCVTVVGGMHNYAGRLEYPADNAVEGQTTINIFSGNFGRIIAGARNDGAYNTTSHNIFGHPDHPHRVEVNIAIKHTPGKGIEEYAPEQALLSPTSANRYKYDIGLLAGGQTDGSVYVESKQNMLSGKVGRFISGNISYGRQTYKKGATMYPSDGFYGSSVLNLEGGEIGELVGGTLGRHSCTAGPTESCEAYFYGRSILNINGGFIDKNIYGAGAGGVVGLHKTDSVGNPVAIDGVVPHTADRVIPCYAEGTDYNGYRKVDYREYYDARENMPVMVMLKEDAKLKRGADGKRNVLSLAETYCEVNVNGGVVKGDVFGGGYGYAVQVAPEKILEQAGYLFGRSYVTVNGGVVKGNIYGGGAGASQYHRMATDSIAHATTTTKVDWTAKAEAFKKLACLYGDTHVELRGGVVEGHVYAGSKGISGYPEMATLYGSTSLVTEDVEISDNLTRVPVINGNIFGGSDLGRIEGDTHVNITGGAIGNAIFGGSEGIESGTDKTTARINGSTYVTVKDGTYFTSEHVGKISPDNHLQLAASDRTFNIYGGGYRNCVIDGSTHVNITRSLLTSYKCLLEGRTFEECVNDRTYRKFSVYGAGRGELTDVKGSANIDINITGGATVPSAKPIDVANSQQFFMIAGGGMAGHVWGDTHVNLDGNVFARRIYGGGMYGNVLGNANMTVRRGSYYGVFGGGLLGNVKGRDGSEHAANLQIGTRIGEKLDGGVTVTAEMAADANRNLYIYDNVYGGNDVSGCTGYETTDQLWNDGDTENITNLPQGQNFITDSVTLVMSEEDARHHYLFEHWDNMGYPGKPYYRHLIKADETKGVNMKICGGRILGDVFGAGNGNHTGYYVPNNADSEHHNAGTITRMMFYEGLPYHYRVNKKDRNSYVGTPTYNPETNTYSGTLRSVLDPQVRQDYGLYEYRPRVGKVVMHIGGNSESDRVEINGDVYGGGHACTIGRYDPARDVLTDPLRFEGGGSLKINFGSHVTVKKSVYMGSRGMIIGEQTTIQPSNVYETTTLNSDYDYHYFDPDYDNGDGTTGRYLLGFPNTKEGRMCFHAYMQLVNMDATTELTFFDQTDNTESTDVRWGSFFAGGARGSMTKLILPKSDPKYNAAKTKLYEYTLPAGLTVESRVVGGSEDAEITYYEYKEKTGDNAFTEIDTDKPIFTFYGGIVYDSHDPDGHHYGGGRVKWHDVSYDASSDTQRVEDDKMVGDESPRDTLTVMRLTVNCQFDPQKAIARNDDYLTKYSHNPPSGEVSDDGEQYWGGLVYGGCYNSGITNGSVEVTCTNTLLGRVDEGFRDFNDYLTASSLRRNVACVYGGGFGERTSVLGNTKVTIQGHFRGFNVFGGGMMGSVVGGTEVNVQDSALVYNAVYGGGMLGNVGKETYVPLNDGIIYAKGTHVNLISGGVDRVYGGAFMGSVYGGTHITVSDSLAVVAAGEGGDKTPTRLLVGTIYGGNDVTGTIHKDENAYLRDKQGNTTENPANGLTTYITVSEKPSAKKTAANRFFLTSESKDEPGKFYAGYPMIGTIYGAGNGDMSDYVKGVTIDRENQCYSGGRVHIATGNEADYRVFDMTEDHSPLPNVETSKIDITGGTIINVYAGGSMCTTTESNNVIVHYADTVARAAFATAGGDAMTWGILRLNETLQQEEVTETKGDYTRFSHQIYRAFGGNKLMDMAIQPTLDMRKGYIYSVYSGGNFGRMTYRNPKETLGADEFRGLSLTINSPDIHISSVYGGGRVGDIDAGVDFEGADEYGATLNIRDGLIGDVYGGNNVAGNVRNGTNVNISGAISGNVYGSGNGNYIYVYNHADADSINNQPVDHKYLICEGYDEDYGGRYFILPRKIEHIEGSDTVYYGNSAEDKILAINSYRPNVDRSFLNIEGSESRQVYVLGDVYCGGNSSTVLFDPAKNDGNGDIRFRIGNYVTLGGVFLGSNGKGLANAFNITYLANLNHITDLNAPTTKGTAEELALYPNLLSLYMRAAEVTALPTELSLPQGEVKDAHIGNFCLGGNRGSMMTNTTIDLTLPEGLVIFGRVVGGCYNSLVEYKGATSMGGMTRPLASGFTNKVDLKVRSTFRPWRMEFSQNGFDPAHPSAPDVRLVNDRQKKTKVNGEEVFVDVTDAEAAAHPDVTYYYNADRCSIYGGCYTSGKTVGDVNIDLYSDVIGRYVTADASTQEITENGEKILADAQKRYLQVNRKQLVNNTSERRTVFAVTGGGYGPLSELYGDVRIRFMPQATTETTTTHPTAATIFGGAHNGKHIGNSTTEIRDGMVFSNLYAGSCAAYKYGSSEVIVGYPTYYKCTTAGTYTLDRADKITKVATTKRKNHDQTPVIRETVKYRVGDIVAKNVYDQIIAHDPAQSSGFSDAIVESPSDEAYGSKWDNIDINIGDNSAMNDPSAHFYGGGGIYGGGHAINSSSVTHSGINTQLAFSDKDEKGKAATNYLDAADIGYGGNSTIIIGDNPANRDLAYTTIGPDGEQIRDHISIGTAHYVEASLDMKNGDKIGKYVKQTDTATGKVSFVHQPSGKPVAGVTYYDMKADGGVYGDGRRTFVENFRAVDITGYGYADYTPQSAKLINTFQRIDLLSLNDCCLQLQGAQDYATNTIDASYYSIARVGELRMNTTLTGDIPASTDDPGVAGNMRLDTPRSRNYMGFFSNVHYIGAMHSNTDFDSDYRGADGKTVSGQSYKAVKKGYIDNYENPSHPDHDNESKFKPRNLATAPNMVGINNGYTLKLQNAYTTGATSDTGMLKEVPVDSIYYGPIVGVVEVKLLTLATDEGGGYIYAFNQHEDDTSKPSGKGFLEETGNFVYPASVNAETNNYIIDDCYPFGYYADTHHATDEEVHYWFVQGHHYYYNTTLTAYTYNGDLINFKLNNADDLIILSGITPATGSTINVESVRWESHLEDDDQCALTNNLNTSGTDSRSDYQLYLTIDGNPNNEYDLKTDGSGNYTNVGNAFVARIPNGNNQTDADDNVTSAAYAANADGTVQQHSNYSGTDNSPLLGIRLQDTDNQNYKPDFYHAHLEDDDHLVITITAEDAADHQQNTYTIKLRLVYLQGPYISGHLMVENCALPGEYIYANTGEVTVELDDALTVTAKKWYLYPRLKADPSMDIYTWDTANGIDVSEHLMDNITGDVNRIQLPARYYQHDWKLGYSIIVNGQPFPLEDSNSDETRLTVHNYHRMSTVAKAVKGDLTYGYDLDLDLVGGALVYIEDDEDFAIFTKYVNYCNGYRREMPAEAGGYEYRMALPTANPSDPAENTSPDAVLWQRDKGGDRKWARVLHAEVLPGYNRYGFITGFSNSNTVLGYDDTQNVEFTNLKNPSGGEGIRFVLNADVTVGTDASPIDEFRGLFYGNGHTVSFGNGFRGRDFILRNYGQIRDVGFVSNGGENAGDVTYVVKSNRGIVENSYYYHFPPGNPGCTDDFSTGKYSGLVGRNDSTHTVSGAVQDFAGYTSNCVQNTNLANADATYGVRYRPNKMFHNGRVAYNLNREYLHARYISRDNDDDAHELMELPSYDAATGQNTHGDYLFNYYADGEYRYASVRSAEHPECLRMAENHGVPNYEDNLHNGLSLHYTGDDAQPDARRWFKISTPHLVKRDNRGSVVYDTDADGNTVLTMTDEGYFPIYRYDALDGGQRSSDHLAAHSDYIFFGQRLTTGADRDYYPRRVNSTNRVYRAGGSYGSRTDLGFHFNRDAHVFSPEITAIDFTGQADLKDATGESLYEANWGYYYYYYYYGGGLPVGTSYDTYENEDENKISAMVDDKELRMLIYYPPILDLPGGPGDHNLHNVTALHVDSNDSIYDYTKVTKNLLIYTPEANDAAGGFSSEDSKRLFDQFHYTRMQRWGEPNGETNQNDIIGHHINWMSHDDDATLEAHFHAANGFFHLADAQDFNAPIEFYVAADGSDETSGRAWMLRQPNCYTTRTGSEPDANGFTISKNAWESISLPFTCNRLVAVNSGDYRETYSRGQITHFYGDDEERGVTHHDYWLRGLVGTAADGYVGDEVVASAAFARPGAAASHLFDLGAEQMRGDYAYDNNWFYTAYEKAEYNGAHNEYSDTLQYLAYPYLTKNAPYIIAFPGEDYREFDLSGKFYNKMNSTAGCHAQEILYEFTVDEIDANNNFDAQTLSVRVPVTDIYDPMRHTQVVGADGTLTTHHGVFARLSGEQITDDMYVLNVGPVSGVNVHGVQTDFPAGSVFLNCRDYGITEILPFRTYLTVTLPSGAMPAPGYITIGDGTRGLGLQDDEFRDDDKPGDETGQPFTGLMLFVENNQLVIISGSATRLPLHGISGRLYRYLDVRPGRNVYTDLHSGFYIAAGKKFGIRP